MPRLRQVNVHRDRVPVILEWLIADASRPLGGLEHAVRGGASDVIILREATGVGSICQIIVAGGVML
jgi:hypothetical protein